MALSEQEQRLLDEMERSLYQNDADVVSTTPNGGSMISAKAVTIIVLSVAVGLGVVIGGVASSLPWLGLIGFVLMIAGVAWALYGSNGKSDSGADAADSFDPRRGSSGRTKADGNFMSRVEDRWERRRDGEL